MVLEFDTREATHFKNVRILIVKYITSPKVQAERSRLTTLELDRLERIKTFSDEVEPYSMFSNCYEDILL